MLCELESNCRGIGPCANCSRVTHLLWRTTAAFLLRFGRPRPTLGLSPGLAWLCSECMPVHA